MAFDTQTELISPTGATLRLYISHAEDARGVMHVNHGLAEHAARYARFADFLAGRGFHVYAHDHRGHGHTRAPDAPLGRFGRERQVDLVLADVLAVHERIAADHGGLPVILFGHSMGGLIALNFALRHSDRIAGAAIWNANFTAGLPGLAAKALLAWERFRLGSDVPSRLLPRLTFQAWGRQIPGATTDFDWLSRDKKEVARYVADPLCGWDASVGMWQAVFDLIFAGADDRNFAAMRRDLPVNLAGGEKDPATAGGKSVTALERRMRAMGFSNLVSKVYAETRHESLNELNRNLIMDELATWAESVVDLNGAGSL
ncbi:alpha/beta hydrolase [Aquamicrobium sp. LC103]|uniref:alpha/beta fold hydrolase n=1 Tax=Aquamicrobium sp. LC103 TaxID=1120658 RepID=UPI00063E92BD|nr:alpha/beta hydrolase [Aquamicrobium sp. LC103]TKT80180.1 alpha/beta hydrolase [Aquamicrobium sp. LC103]